MLVNPVWVQISSFLQGLAHPQLEPAGSPSWTQLVSREKASPLLSDQAIPLRLSDQAIPVRPSSSHLALSTVVYSLL